MRTALVAFTVLPAVIVDVTKAFLDVLASAHRLGAPRER